VAIGTRGGLQDLGPGGLLVLGSQRCLWELGPDLGFGAKGGFREMGFRSLLISWPSCGSGSWDLEPTVGAPFGPYVRGRCVYCCVYGAV
jgi:hypothetical protein